MTLTKLARLSLGLCGSPGDENRWPKNLGAPRRKVLSPDGHWQDIKASICEAPQHHVLDLDHPRVGDPGIEPREIEKWDVSGRLPSGYVLQFAMVV